MSGTKVIIIGAGGHAAELHDYLLHANRQVPESYELLGLLDDDASVYPRYGYSAPYLGAIKAHAINSSASYLVGIANLTYRAPIIQAFLDRSAQFLTFIHPGAYVSASASIGRGSVVGPLANVGPNVRIGEFNLINARCSLGHDTVVGDYNFISPNVCFSGGTRIGDHNLFGINSATIPGISVGHRNKVMAGMVLDKSVGDDQVVFFRYKEKLSLPPPD